MNSEAQRQREHQILVGMLMDLWNGGQKDAAATLLRFIRPTIEAQRPAPDVQAALDFLRIAFTQNGPLDEPTYLAASALYEMTVGE